MEKFRDLLEKKIVLDSIVKEYKGIRFILLKDAEAFVKQEGKNKWEISSDKKRLYKITKNRGGRVGDFICRIPTENDLKDLPQDLLEKKELVDIHQAIKDGNVEKYWGNGLSYEGKDIFDTYMKFYDDIKETIRMDIEDASTITDFNGQEVYLGYNKKKDEFVSGWDCWITKEEENPYFDIDDDESEYEDEFIEEDSSANVTVRFKIIKGKIKIIDTISWIGDIFYQAKGNEGYNAIKKNKDIVDLRLD